MIIDEILVLPYEILLQLPVLLPLLLVSFALWSAVYGVMKLVLPGRDFKGTWKVFFLIAAFDIGALLFVIDFLSAIVFGVNWKRNFVELPFGGEALSNWILTVVICLPHVLIILAAALFLFSRKGSFVRAHRVAIFTALWGAAFLLSAWFYYANTFYMYPLGPSEIEDDPSLTPAQISPPMVVLWVRWLEVCLDRALVFYLWPAYIGLGVVIARRRRRRHKRQELMYDTPKDRPPYL